MYARLKQKMILYTFFFLFLYVAQYTFYDTC
nr:MAG TPA: hypothetical protein [Bacteriophage sp.]